MTPRYKVTLTEEERNELEGLTKKGNIEARRFKYARALLLCDAGPECPSWKVADVADALGVTSRSIEHLKKRFVEGGLDAALDKRTGNRIYAKRTDGDFEAHLIALSCSEPPEGFARWSLRLLADKVVELNYIDSISHETVRRILKKTRSSLGNKRDG